MDQSRLVLDMQLRHFEALDSRAGIILGFSGTLVALTSGRGIATSAGRALAATAALFALIEFVPRWFPSISLRALRDSYGAGTGSSAKAAIISMHVRLMDVARLEAQAKARRLGQPGCSSRPCFSLPSVAGEVQ